MNINLSTPEPKTTLLGSIHKTGPREWQVTGNPELAGQEIKIRVELQVLIAIPGGKNLTIELDEDDPRIIAAVHASSMVGERASE